MRTLIFAALLVLSACAAPLQVTPNPDRDGGIGGTGTADMIEPL